MDKNHCSVYRENRKSSDRKVGHYKNADYLEYEIRYFVSGEERRGWYAFHPLDDPDPDEIKGSELQIRYNGKKPWLFEAIE